VSALFDRLAHEDFPFGFHLTRKAWDRFYIGTLRRPASEAAGITEHVYRIRGLADRINRQRDFGRPGVRPARTGELLAMGLILDILRYIADLYLEEEVPGVMARGLDDVRTRVGAAVADTPPPAFAALYTPQRVMNGALTEEAYLAGRSDRLTNVEGVARELILLHLAMLNPAMRPYQELFDDTDLRAAVPYERLVHSLETFFSRQPALRIVNDTLFNVLRRPMIENPDSLEGQLDFIRRYWRDLLPAELLERLMVARGILKEETAWRGFGPGPVRVLEFGRGLMGYPEPEAFSVDKDWMPNVVLIAKSTYVWLDQLSKKYQRRIHRLDHVPDEELDRLARWGINALWLIGLWERSPASQWIKQIMGNSEAVASAYSLYDYEIAADLGGPDAYEGLKERAWHRGIRLASDMVPNHVGIYSRWVVEHPDWFLQLPYPPYPKYTFTGPNLSADPRISLQVEDGYWSRTDAAVVFQRRDNWTGDARYIYHGNDGTNMPWNDTAQLNFLLPEVREAVVQTILHVARQFPIIRFDAAMTLAKKHYQRLWFPKHDDEGSVPSRAEHGMSREEFDAAFPKEFWREVVDRVAAEAPETLLLAEAFWLMEGYFVRTLGMHRVYNSAFMNMLKMEENSKYRQTVKNVLEFSPEVLQRFVNFMNNPDELTAVEQFGKGDKYFGVCVLMATMPGLPMFGHGQVEGFAEKYGMEYRRAYWDEAVDEHLVRRHEAEIFPLVRRRRLFSGAGNFAFFDFVTPEGWVDENVFAYTNRNDGDRALIVYNNAYKRTRGAIRLSTAINVGAAEDKQLVRRTLAEALGLVVADDRYYVFRDYRAGLDYLHHARELAEVGLDLELHGYQYYAFLDWREVRDHDLTWAQLHATLGRRGVPSIEEAYQELVLAPVLDPFRAVMNSELLALLTQGDSDDARQHLEQALGDFLIAVAAKIGRKRAIPVITRILSEVGDEITLLHEFRSRIAALDLHPEVASFLLDPIPKKAAGQPGFWRVPAAWSALRRLGRLLPAERGVKHDEMAVTASWMRDWFLVKCVAQAFRDMDGDEHRANLDAGMVRACIAHGPRLVLLQQEPWGPILYETFRDPDTQRFLGMNQWGGRIWLVKEQLERYAHMMLVTHAITALSEGAVDGAEIETLYDNLRELLLAAEDAGYDVERTLESLK